MHDSCPNGDYGSLRATGATRTRILSAIGKRNKIIGKRPQASGRRDRSPVRYHTSRRPDTRRQLKFQRAAITAGRAPRYFLRGACSPHKYEDIYSGAQYRDRLRFKEK
ncbi:hypothetical protein EVAR_43991_1 [Eumeta japonica]|uniref:Uncharacterized protein n=1 Tax=Eumeta variegata TaxID=151549 RepID=A0A4C1XEK4_EUMVA|nr:hypothetical protein EVAR_43991_1 [Eumeta japonica]